jgi:hypothetical protein
VNERAKPESSLERSPNNICHRSCIVDDCNRTIRARYFVNRCCDGRRNAEIGVDLNQITIPCENYEKSVDFYRQLGLRLIVDSPPRYARFETTSGTTLSIHHAEADAV